MPHLCDILEHIFSSFEPNKANNVLGYQIFLSAALLHPPIAYNSLQGFIKIFIIDLAV